MEVSKSSGRRVEALGLEVEERVERRIGRR